MNIKDYSKYFKEIKSNICNIYNEFYVMDSLQNDKYEEIFNQNKYFWGIIIRSLGQSIMIELAKLFKESDGAQKEVSVYSLIRFIKNDNTRAKIKNKINQHQNIIDKLRKQRCRIFVHTDEKVFLSPENFLVNIL